MRKIYPPEVPRARIFRQVDDLPHKTLCRFLRDENVLLINSRLWGDLTPEEQRDIMRTPRTIVTNERLVDDVDRAA